MFISVEAASPNGVFQNFKRMVAYVFILFLFAYIKVPELSWKSTKHVGCTNLSTSFLHLR